MGIEAVHETAQYQNNRAEISHQPTRQRERQMRRFKSPCHAQRFLSTHGPINNQFRVSRHLVSSQTYKTLRNQAMSEWENITGIASKT